MSNQDHITVRPAVPQDAESACAVLVASINDLCAADHKNDPKVIAAWTANKTPSTVQGWIENDRSTLIVAEHEGQIIGVAGYTMSGEVTLNYVAPRFQYQGVSDRILTAVEQEMRSAGLAQAYLVSTATAERFYRARGWRAEGPVDYAFGMPGQPMVKDLA